MISPQESGGGHVRIVTAAEQAETTRYRIADKIRELTHEHIDPAHPAFQVLVVFAQQIEEAKDV